MEKKLINKYSISMKLIILIFFAIFFDLNQGYSQEILSIDIEMSAEEGLSYIHQDLNPNEIPSGVLLDRIVPSLDYDLFLDSGPPPILTPHDWRSIYFDIQRASIATSSLPELNGLEDESVVWLNQQIYPIYLTYLEFNDLHPNAYQNEWITFDGERFQDGTGNGQESRLRDYNLLIGTTFRTTIWKTEATFRIGYDFYHTNTSHVPHTIEIDFDDGQGYRTNNLTSVYTETINWGSPGIKEIKIKAHFSGFSRESRFTVKVSDMDPAPDFYLEGLYAPLSYEGINAGYSYYVFLGEGNTSIRRPIIITDGFDPDNSRLVDRIFAELNDIDNNQFKIASDLLSAGYDIIIMDFEDATTYIQANAFALVDLINTVNNLKTTNDELIVIGPSMGALVVQYALAYMSHNNLDHQTRLMISFDGAHQGANIPIGIQLAIHELQDEHALAKQFKRILSRPAPRQLLMYSAYSVSPFTGPNDPLRANLYSELNDMGRYPQEIRKIAISKGSGYGLNQLGYDDVTRMNPGSLIFEGKGGIPLIATVKMELYAAQNKQFNKIVRLPTKLEVKKIIGIPYGFSIHEKTWYLSDTLPYDSSPGGYTEFLNDTLLVEFKNFSLPIPAYLYGSIYFLKMGFVPTISSLDFNTTSQTYQDIINNKFMNQDLTYNISQDSNADSRTPFDAYYYPVENLSHLGINQEIYDFVMYEIGPPSIFFNQNVTIANATIIEENQRVFIDDGVKVTFNGAVTVNKGSKWLLGHNASIEFNGSVSIVGTQSDPIVFKNNIGSSRWNNIVSLAGSSIIEWSVFRGGNTGLRLHGSNNHVTNSAFRHNYYGLWLNSVSGTTLTNSVIENNTYEGLLVFDSGHNGNSISYNTITGNGQAGVYMYNSELRDFHGNVIETNNTRGVEVLAGSNLFMQEYLGSPPQDKGLNRIKNNNNHQVYITHSSRAYLGDSWFSTTNAGHNSVFHTSGPGTNRKYIYNLAVTGPGYSGTPYNILAQHSYWDLYPSSGMFHGPVDYTNYLWGIDPTTGSGAGSGQTPQQSIQSGQGPIVHVLSAGMSGALASSYENPEHAVQALALKQRMMELRDALAADEWHPHNARRLNELYTLSLLDTGDLLQEAGNVEVTLTTWAERGSSMRSTYRDEEQVKLAIETALLIRVKQSLRAGDYARTAALITGASPLIGNADHRMALMKNAISVYAYHGQHEAALDVLRQVRAIEPEKEVAAWYDAPNLRPVEAWLTDASKEKRPGGGAADLLAQVLYHGSSESAMASGGFSLGSNYPNPFNPSTIIPFELPSESRVHIEVYDLLGRLVTTLSNDMYQAGAHQVVWDARASASGVYLIRAVIEPQQVIYNRRQFTRTVTLLK